MELLDTPFTNNPCPIYTFSGDPMSFTVDHTPARDIETKNEGSEGASGTSSRIFVVFSGQVHFPGLRIGSNRSVVS